MNCSNVKLNVRTAICERTIVIDTTSYKEGEETLDGDVDEKLPPETPTG